MKSFFTFSSILIINLHSLCFDCCCYKQTDPSKIDEDNSNHNSESLEQILTNTNNHAADPERILESSDSVYQGNHDVKQTDTKSFQEIQEERLNAKAFEEVPTTEPEPEIETPFPENIPKLIARWSLKRMFTELNKDDLNQKSDISRAMDKAKRLGYDKYFKDHTPEELYERYKTLAKVCGVTVITQINNNNPNPCSAIARIDPPYLSENNDDDNIYESYCKANENAAGNVPSFGEWYTKLGGNKPSHVKIDTSPRSREYIKYLNFSGIAEPGASTKFIFMSGEPVPPGTKIIINGYTLPDECKNTEGKTFEKCQILLKSSSELMQHMSTKDPYKIFPRNNVEQFRFFTKESDAVTEDESDCNELFDGLDPSREYGDEDLYNAFNVEKFAEIMAPWIQYHDDFWVRYATFGSKFKFRDCVLRRLITRTQFDWVLKVDRFEEEAVHKKLEASCLFEVNPFGYGRGLKAQGSILHGYFQYRSALTPIRTDYPLSTCFPNIPESEIDRIRGFWNAEYVTFDGIINQTNSQ